jgi:hypothetical protein
MARFTAIIVRTNGAQLSCDILATSLMEAEQIARDLMRDGETLVVEHAELVVEEVLA